MNLLQLIAQTLESPQDARETLQAQDVNQQVIDAILPLRDLQGAVQVEENGRWTSLSYRNDLLEKDKT